MSEIENIIHKFLKEQVTPIIESAVSKAVKQALREQNTPTPSTENKYLNAQAAASYIGDELSTFYKRIHKKEIPRHGPKGRIFCDKADLDAFISQKQSSSVLQMYAEAERALQGKPKRRGRRKAA